MGLTNFFNSMVISIILFLRQYRGNLFSCYIQNAKPKNEIEDAETPVNENLIQSIAPYKKENEKLFNALFYGQTFDQDTRWYIGVSIYQKSAMSQRENIITLIQFAQKKLGKCAIFIADDITRFNMWNFKLKSSDNTKALSRSRIEGDKYYYKFQGILDELEVKSIELVRWKNATKLQEKIDIVKSEYEMNKLFRDRVNTMAHHFALARGAKGSLAEKTICSSHYILEEIPIIACGLNTENGHYPLLCYPTTVVDVSSASIFSLIHEIKTKSEYAGLREKLGIPIEPFSFMLMEFPQI